MAWSTRRVAELAGTTVNTVRHYHEVGILDLPVRATNGYKQYEVSHLIRLLQIRRLRELGVPLAAIEDVGSDGESGFAALAVVEADLSASIERLQRARREIRSILDTCSTADVPSGWEGTGGKLSATDRSLILIYAQLYDESAMTDLRAMLEAEKDDAGIAFDELGPDADEAARRELAEDYAQTIARNMRLYPWLLDPTQRMQKRPSVVRATYLEAVSALYNPAQLDVIGRAGAMAHDLVTRENAENADPPQS